MIAKDNKPTRVSSFGGGLNTKVKELNGMDISESPDCMDVYSDVDGALHKRHGRTRLNSAAVGAGTKDANILYDFSGTAFSIFGTSSFKMDELDGTWDALDTGLTDSAWFADNYAGTLVTGNYDYATPRTWNGTATTTTAITDTDCPRARYPKSWENYVWWWNVKGNTSRLQRSDYGSATAYTATSYNDIITHNGDIGTGIGELKGVMYCFKRWSLHRVSYLGGTPLVDIRQMTRGVGTIAHNTIKNVTVPGKGENLIFLGADRKLYMFDGYNATPISTKFEEGNNIAPMALDTINLGGMKFAHAIVDETNHWYVLFVPNGGDSTITHCFAYNYHTGACFPFSNQTLSASSVMIDSNGKQWIIVGDYSGFAHRWNYGNVDHATTISAYHTTPRLFYQSPSTLAKPRYIRLDLKTHSDDTVSFQHREDYNESWSTADSISLYNSSSEQYLGTAAATGLVLGTGVLGPDKNIVHTTIGLPYTTNFVQFKISDSLTVGPWTLYSYDFLGKPVGYGHQQ